MIYYPGKYESMYPSFSFFRINLTAGLTGMNPNASFGNRFRSKLRGIKPSALRDNSTNSSNFTSFVFRESHYNLPIPLRL